MCFHVRQVEIIMANLQMINLQLNFIKMAEESWKKGERRRKFYETNRISLNSFLFKKVKYLADNDPKEFIINQNNQTISDLNIRQKDRRFSYDKNRTSSKIKSVLNFEEEEEQDKYIDKEMYRKSSPLLIDKLLRWNILKNKKYKRKASVFSEASESVKKRRILTTKQPIIKPLSNKDKVHKREKSDHSQKSLGKIKVKKLKRNENFQIQVKQCCKLTRRVVEEERNSQKKQRQRSIYHLKGIYNINKKEKLKEVQANDFRPWSGRSDSRIDD